MKIIKKMTILLTAVVIAALMAVTFNDDVQIGASLMSTIGVFAILFLSYFYFEKSDSGTKEIAILGTLSAFAAISRIIFAPIPNVTPTTFLVALTGFVFGSYEGFLVGSTAAFLSNIFFGQGPWTPWQMFSWGLVGIIAGFWGKKKKVVSDFKFSVVCFLFGFMFDWIMNLWFISGFVKPVNWGSIIGTYMAGLTFDVLHGRSSFIFYDSFIAVFQRYKRKLNITYIRD